MGAARWSKLWSLLVIASAQVAVAQNEAPEEESGPGDPVAMRAPPRVLADPEAVPDVPDRLPDRVAVLAFENRARVHTMDWAVAALPFEVGEKVESVFPLAPTWDELVIPPGLAAAATPEAVAAIARTSNARWVFAGWSARPAWQLELGIELWRIDAGGPVRVASASRTGAFQAVHQMIGSALLEVATAAGWPVSAEASLRLSAPISSDFYAYSLLGRGLGHLRGAFGPVNRAAADHDLLRAVFIDPKMAAGQRLVGELWKRDPLLPRAAQRAAGKFQYALDLAPSYVPALQAAAATSAASGRRDLARDLYRRLVRIRPWQLDARLELGDALWQTGDAEGALRELSRVVRHAPDELRARRILALIHASRGDTSRLTQELEEVLRRSPADLDARADLGAAYAAAGRWQDAATAWQQVAEARPDATALKRVGDALRRAGKPEVAMTWYSRATQASPGDPRPAFLLGEVLLAQGNVEGAHRWFLRAQRYGDYLGYTYTALGTVAEKRGQRGEALWYLRRAAKLRPRSRIARHDYALILLWRHDYDAALALLDPAVAYWPDDVDLLYLRSVAQAGAGQTMLARAGLDEALGREPSFAAARRALIALDRGTPIGVEGELAIEMPFGDGEYLKGLLGSWERLDGQLGELRARFSDQSMKILLTLGEGPAKVRGTATRTCPAAEIARPYAEARQALGRFERLGVELEEHALRVIDLDELGDASALSPLDRSRLAALRRSWRLALADLRELRQIFTVELGRELAVRRCTDARLLAALTQAPPYEDSPAAAPAKPTSAAREPALATIYVDNRACRDDLSVWVDGEDIGEVKAGERGALASQVGRRTLCLLPKGLGSACGDRGTVRQAYLHDGWQVAMKCPPR